MTAPVIMVHGAFCAGWVFDAFRAPFEAAGHEVLTPDLRGHGASSGPVAGVSMLDYAGDIAELAQAQPQPPLLVGHSMGGLVAMLAATRAPVSGLVLLAPSAPWGVAGATMEEAASAFSLYALGPYWLQAIAPDRTIMEKFSLDRAPRAQRDAAAARLTPESGRALWETLNWWLDPFMTTLVPASAIGAPVLALAGGRDLIHPAATVKQTAARLSADFRVLREMSHWLPGEPGWDQAAEICLEWLPSGLRAAA